MMDLIYLKFIQILSEVDLTRYKNSKIMLYFCYFTTVRVLYGPKSTACSRISKGTGPVLLLWDNLFFDLLFRSVSL